MKRGIGIAFLIAIVEACSLAPNTAKLESDRHLNSRSEIDSVEYVTDLEEYAAVSAAVDSIIPAAFKARQRYIVRRPACAECEETDSLSESIAKYFPGFRHFIRKLDPSAEIEMCEDLALKCVSKSLWQRNFTIDAEYNWIDTYDTKGDESITVNVTRVAFSKDRRRGAIVISHACGSLCGASDYVYLAKNGGSWKVSAVYQYLVI